MAFLINLAPVVVISVSPVMQTYAIGYLASKAPRSHGLSLPLLPHYLGEVFRTSISLELRQRVSVRHAVVIATFSVQPEGKAWDDRGQSLSFEKPSS
jgi:hypothetical protein